MSQCTYLENRKGITNELFVSLLISIFIFGLTFFLGSKRLVILSTPLAKLKADYQMESAIIMHYNVLKNSEKVLEEKLSKIFRQELAPGVMLSIQGRKLSNSEYQLKAHVRGYGWEKKLEGRFIKTFSAKMFEGQTSEAVLDGDANWTLKFLPGCP